MIIYDSINQIVSNSFQNTHCHGLHSIVLKKLSPMIRFYYADEDHELWKNKLIFNPKCSFEHSMSIAIHAHRQNITMRPIFGNVTNIVFNREASRYSYNNCKLRSFKYNSPIVYEKGEFIECDNCDIQFIKSELLSQDIFMLSSDLHTVFVPQKQKAAWIIFESDYDDTYDSTCYSNTDLTKFDFSSLYKPMSIEQVTAIINECKL